MFVGGIFLAFILAIRVKLIPWDALTIEENEVKNIKINVDKIPNASFFVKLILKVRGINVNVHDEDFALFLSEYQQKIADKENHNIL